MVIRHNKEGEEYTIVEWGQHMVSIKDSQYWNSMELTLAFWEMAVTKVVDNLISS